MFEAMMGRASRSRFREIDPSVSGAPEYPGFAALIRAGTSPPAHESHNKRRKKQIILNSSHFDPSDH
jgi:hypothetical protein